MRRIYDASKKLSRADWKPEFLDSHQNETLVAFAEILTPATDTAGAKEALVHCFIDAVLAAETDDTRKSIVASLAFLDGESFARHRAAFVYLSPEQQTESITYMAYPQENENAPGSYWGHAHFSNLKDWVSRAYSARPRACRRWGIKALPGVFSRAAKLRNQFS